MLLKFFLDIYQIICSKILQLFLYCTPCNATRVNFIQQNNIFAIDLNADTCYQRLNDMLVPLVVSRMI